MKCVPKQNYIHVESLQSKINFDSINFNTIFLRSLFISSRFVIADDNRVPVSPECWGQPLIGCNVNAMTQIISGVAIGE